MRFPSSAARLNAQMLFDDFLVDDRRLGSPDSPWKSELLWVDTTPNLIPEKHPDTLFNSFLRQPQSRAHRFYEGELRVTEIVIRIESESVGMIRVKQKESSFTSSTHMIYILAHLIESALRKHGFEISGMDRVLAEDFSRVREEMGFSRELLAAKLLIPTETLARWETGYMPPLSLLYRWLEALQMVCPARNNVVQVIDVSERILSKLIHDPEELFKLTPDSFEEFVAERLDKMGFVVSRTGKTNRKDGGIDIIAVPKGLGNYLLAAQVKHHKHGYNSGRTDVDRLLSWKEKFAVGMLVTNTGFTPDAKWVADQHKFFLKLRDFEDIRNWLANNYTGENREIPSEIELAPGIKVKIPKPSNALIHPDNQDT
jgi:transcriptional regulator with XRE-family HTH domain